MSKPRFVPMWPVGIVGGLIGVLLACATNPYATHADNIVNRPATTTRKGTTAPSHPLSACGARNLAEHPCLDNHQPGSVHWVELGLAKSSHEQSCCRRATRGHHRQLPLRSRVLYASWR